MRFGPFAALLTVLVGCATPAPGTDAYLPAGPTGPWTQWKGPWVMQSDGCGLCEGANAQAAEMTLTAIDADGHVLRVDYAIGGTQDVVLVGPALEGWRPVVVRLFTAHDQYGQEREEGHVRVFAVHTATLMPSDGQAIHEHLARATLQVRPLPPANMTGCEDCGAPVVHAGGLRAELDGHSPEDSGWPSLGRQMALLRAWVAGELVPA
jgi:hypothetical protein